MTFVDLKKEPTNPKNAPICHILNPSMPMAERIAKIGLAKKMPTTQPVNAPMIVPRRAYTKNIPATIRAWVNISMNFIIIVEFN